MSSVKQNKMEIRIYTIGTIEYSDFVNRCLEPRSFTPRYLGANLSAEAGETIGVMAKAQRKNYDMRTYCQKINDELGDVFFMLHGLGLYLELEIATVVEIPNYSLSMRLDTIEFEVHRMLLEMAKLGLKARDEMYVDNHNYKEYVLTRQLKQSFADFYKIIALYQMGGYADINLNRIMKANYEKLGERHGYK